MNVSKELPEGTNKALFLDRDGIINVNHGYVIKKQDIDWIPGIFDLVKDASDKGYKVIVITNQSGIGRGYYSENEFQELCVWMTAQFKDQGATIDAIYHCPHHPVSAKGKYLKQCNCRKPAPGMGLQAKGDFNLSLQNSVMVGDRMSDMEMAANGKIGRAYLFSDKYNLADLPDSTHTRFHLISQLQQVSL